MFEMGDADADVREEREGDLQMVSRGIIKSCNTELPRRPSAIIAFAVKRHL